MVWSWSHSQSAYDDLKQHIESKDRNWMEVVYAEWQVRVADDPEAFNEKRYKQAIAKAKKLSDEELAEFIWEKTSEQAICENGGFEAWCCPYGCGPHTLPWKNPDAEEDEDDDTFFQDVEYHDQEEG